MVSPPIQDETAVNVQCDAMCQDARLELERLVTSGSDSPVYPVLGATLCVGLRLVGLRYGVNVPIAPSERDRPRT